MQRQIDDLKASVEKIQSESIPTLSSKIVDVENDFLETCKTIETDFDALNKKVDEKLSLQDRMAAKIDMIFEKMNLVLPLPSDSSDSESAEESDEMVVVVGGVSGKGEKRKKKPKDALSIPTSSRRSLKSKSTKSKPLVNSSVLVSSASSSSKQK